mmetsp:Transcript_54551/g.152156  ORF Transcript_54551/g.152156 Transcript_54551/m.152156 type:complete len:286 (-) Transcript_54551:46-903(-)
MLSRRRARCNDSRGCGCPNRRRQERGGKRLASCSGVRCRRRGEPAARPRTGGVPGEDAGRAAGIARGAGSGWHHCCLGQGGVKIPDGRRPSDAKVAASPLAVLRLRVALSSHLGGIKIPEGRRLLAASVAANRLAVSRLRVASFSRGGDTGIADFPLLGIGHAVAFDVAAQLDIAWPPCKSPFGIRWTWPSREHRALHGGVDTAAVPFVDNNAGQGRGDYACAQRGAQKNPAPTGLRTGRASHRHAEGLQCCASAECPIAREPASPVIVAMAPTLASCARIFQCT